MKNVVFKDFVKLKPGLKPGVDEPVIELKPDRRGPVEQGECIGGDRVNAEWDKQLMGPIADEVGVEQGGVNSVDL